MKTRPFLAFLSVLLTTAPALQAQTTSAPATAPRPFGKPEQGIRTSAALSAPASPDRLAIDLLLDAQTAAPVSLEGAFLWLTFAQGKDKAYFSAQIPLATLAANPPATLPANAPLTLACDFAAAKAYAYRADLLVKDGYPDLGDAPSVGTLGKLLPQGRSRGRVTLYIPSLKALVASNPIDIVVDTPDISQILPGFLHDPVAAKDAHDRCVKIGPATVPGLIKLLEDKQTPWFGQMWVAATLLDLGDARAVPVLVATLKKGGSAAHVIAYHGAKLKSSDLATAIEGAAKDPLTAAWAARGSLEFSRTPRPELVDTAIAAMDKPGDHRALLECLEKITGQKLGDDAAKWKTWWAAHRAEFTKTKP